MRPSFLFLGYSTSPVHSNIQIFCITFLSLIRMFCGPTEHWRQFEPNIKSHVKGKDAIQVSSLIRERLCESFDLLDRLLMGCKLIGSHWPYPQHLFLELGPQLQEICSWNLNRMGTSSQGSMMLCSQPATSKIFWVGPQRFMNQYHSPH